MNCNLEEFRGKKNAEEKQNKNQSTKQHFLKANSVTK